jgi:hypothetical protein
MKSYILAATVLPLSIMACSVSLTSGTPTSVTTPTPASTATTPPSATLTRAPTATRTPAPTFEQAPDFDPGLLEGALRTDGYKRYPFYDASTGADAFFWDNGSGVVFYTYDEGFEMSLLNDPHNLPGRVKLIDRAIDIVAPLFTSQFIDDLEEEAHDYAERVISVTGDPTVIDYGDEPWLGKLLEFNGYGTSIRNGSEDLPVYLRLLYREYKCDMNKYLYCYFYDMPTMTYSGGATLTFFNIWIEYPRARGGSSG